VRRAFNANIRQRKPAPRLKSCSAKAIKVVLHWSGRKGIDHQSVFLPRQILKAFRYSIVKAPGYEEAKAIAGGPDGADRKRVKFESPICSFGKLSPPECRNRTVQQIIRLRFQEEHYRRIRKAPSTMNDEEEISLVAARNLTTSDFRTPCCGKQRIGTRDCIDDRQWTMRPAIACAI